MVHYCGTCAHKKAQLAIIVVCIHIHTDPMNITTSDVNITVLFEPDRSPLVIVDVKVYASFIKCYIITKLILTRSFHGLSVFISM